MRRGPLAAGEKVQFTDRRSNKITDQLVPGGVTQTSHGIILHDDVIGQTEGSVVVTVSAKREAQVNQTHPERDANKPWKGTRAIGGWEFAVIFGLVQKKLNLSGWKEAVVLETQRLLFGVPDGRESLVGDISHGIHFFLV